MRKDFGTTLAVGSPRRPNPFQAPDGPLSHPSRYPPHGPFGAAKTQIHQHHLTAVASPPTDAPQVAAACQGGLGLKAAPLAAARQVIQQ